jgi:ADP-heptose:LPS heptosyltransferase
MNVRSMRRVDRWIGAPLCFALTLARRVGDVLRPADGAAAPRRIAVIKLAEQGATVLAYPALCQAARAVGPENLFFVVFAENRFILDLLGVVPAANVVSIRTDGLLRVIGDTLRALARLRRERIDTSVDFEFFARSSAILSYVCGARRRVGFHAWHGEASYRGDLMTHRLSFNPFLHAREMFRMLIHAAEQPPGKLPACEYLPADEAPLPEYRSDERRLGEVRAILRESLGVEPVPRIVLLNANCSDLLPLRRWPPERYVELARRLLDRHPDVAIVFTGAPAEAPDAEALVRRVVEAGPRRCISLAGRTTMPQLLALYELASLLVTNDSGPAQYATLTPIEVIVLFGPETPAVFAPRTPRTHVLWSGIACSPCVNAFNDRQSACRDNVCLQRITVDQVLALASGVLERRPALSRRVGEYTGS